MVWFCSYDNEIHLQMVIQNMAWNAASCTSVLQYIDKFLSVVESVVACVRSFSMTSNVMCAVCGELVENFELVQLTVKGLSSLINASKEKNDGKHEEWQHSNLSQLGVLESCRKMYIRRRKSTREPVPGCSSGPPTPEKAKLCGEEAFDFVHHCLICSLRAGSADENKKPKNRRDQIMLVSTLEAKDSLLQMAAKRRDALGKTVSRLLSNVIDLVAAEGKYHCRCHKPY